MRTCTKCNSKMSEGFYIEHAFEYYCTESCLYSELTPSEYKNMYNSDDAYWTQW